jgi:Adenomatosis polyposis coli down-regulated 1
MCMTFKYGMHTVMGGALVAGLVAGCAGHDADDDREAARQALVGHWTSEACETRPAPGGGHLYLRRDFTIDAAQWSGWFAFFTDDTCTTLTSVAYSEGPYTVDRRSTAAPDGHEMEFVESVLRVTQTDPGVVGYLDGAPHGTCGDAPFALDVAQDVTSTHGCAALGVDLAACGTEHELVKRTGDELFFGARPADGSGLCTAAQRPTSYQVPLRRTEPAAYAGTWHYRTGAAQVTCPGAPAQSFELGGAAVTVDAPTAAGTVVAHDASGCALTYAPMGIAAVLAPGQSCKTPAGTQAFARGWLLAAPDGATALAHDDGSFTPAGKPDACPATVSGTLAR